MGTEIVSESVMDNGYEDSDDDQPISSKWKRYFASYSNQSKSNTQRSKAVPSTKVSPIISPVTSSNDMRRVLVSPEPLRSGYEDSDDDQPISSNWKRSVASYSNQSKSNPRRSKAVPSSKTVLESVMDDGYEDNSDDKPLVFKRKSGYEDSDDEKPLVYKRKSGYEDNDYDKPLMFKRGCSVASNSNQSKSNSQSSKAVPSYMVSPMRSPVASPNSKGRVLVSPKPINNGYEDSDDDKPLVFKRKSSVASKTVPSSKTVSESVMYNGYEDSSADEPLVFKRKSGYEDSDDDKPLVFMRISGYEDSDDDKPLVFKRERSVASNSNQSKSNSQRSKAVPSYMVSPMRSPVASPISKGRVLVSPKPINNGYEDSDDEKPLIFKRKSSVASKTVPSSKTVSESVMDNGYEDSSDDKPLVFKRKSGYEDSDDDKPLVFKRKSGYENSDDDKPLVFKRECSVASNLNQLKSNSQRSKAVPSNMVSPIRRLVTSPNGTTPSNRYSTMKYSMLSCSSKDSPAKSPGFTSKITIAA
ncbi:hypothetical protein CARUB_v10026225mg [Capsella rubella]|uniref:Uncharacterized protein n=1 Tax=Capsella rubella TaxID=81985 RepID=R0GLK9_9BRAS|nr:DNA topoisomerase 1 alpha [Capsella rubella]EOA13200.1 hypothetical protein CARUB_v10026225mg [Capsella rubella]